MRAVNQMQNLISSHSSRSFLVCLLSLALLLMGGACAKKAADGAPGSNPSAAVGAPSPAPSPEAPKIRKPILSYLFGWTSFWQKIFPPKPKPPTAQPVQLIGTVRQVNLDNQFVLIDTITNFSAAPGEVFVTLSKQSQTATLRMSALKSPPFLIADITDGKPSPGDRVFRQ